MEANLISNGFTCYHKIFAQTIEKEETQDCVVPDAQPDLAEIISSCGNILIRSKEVSAGRVRVEANIPVKLSCISEDTGDVFGLNLNIPVYISVDDPQIQEDCFCTTEFKLIRVDSRIINSRKVTAAASIELTVACYQIAQTEFNTAAPDGIADILVKEQAYELSSIVDMKEKTFVLMDEYILPLGKTPMAEILGYQTSLFTEEQKIVGTKAILKGKANSLLLYRSDEMVIDATEINTEFSQIIDLEHADENSLLSTNMLLSGAYFDIAPGFDGRSLKMELHVAAQMKVYGTHKVNCIMDAYSNLYETELQQRHTMAGLIRREITLRDAVREIIVLPQKPSAIIACRACPTQHVISDNVVDCNILLKILYRNEDENVCTTERKLSIQLVADLRAGEVLHFCGIRVTECSVAALANEAECHLQLELKCFVVEKQEINCISGIAYDVTLPKDLSKKASLVILRAGNGADLWAIAKENCSTVKDICAANGLEDTMLHEDKLLLIPKSV